MDDKSKKELLQIAGRSIEEYIKFGKVYEPQLENKELMKDRGAFVTLKINDSLRGCVGRIEPPGQALGQTVRDMAMAAAFEDFRFQPVSLEEYKKLEIEISILSKFEEIDDWKNIKLGEHGVIVEKGSQTGVFLPQVAVETGWTLEEFLSELCEQKAGLSRDAYKNDSDVKLLVFTVEVVK